MGGITFQFSSLPGDDPFSGMKGTVQSIARGSYCGRQLVFKAFSQRKRLPATPYPPYYKDQHFRTANSKVSGLNCLNCFFFPPAFALPHGGPCLRCRIEEPFLPQLIACRRQQGGREVESTSAEKGFALAISAELRDGLHRLGVRKLTDMQRLSLLKTLRGCSLAVAAKPGAGKTLAYLLPILQQFVSDEGSEENAFETGDAPSLPFALLLVPSRELAKQVMAVATALLPRAPLLLLDSTTPLQQQQQMLAHLSPKLIVATPDRVLSLLRPKNRRSATDKAASSRGTPVQAELCLTNLRFLVVDEADALLRQGYMSKVTAIYQAATGKKTSTRQKRDLDAQDAKPEQGSLQVLFFTAVLTRELHALFDSNFLKVEALDFVASIYRQSPGGTSLPTADEDKLREHSTKNRIYPAEHASAIVGAGVEQHVCYLPAPDISTTWSDSKDKASDDFHQTLNATQRRLRTRRSKMSSEEAQIDGERKILALAEILRTYIPTLSFEGRRAFDDLPSKESGAAGWPTDAQIGRGGSSSDNDDGYINGSSNFAGSSSALEGSSFPRATAGRVEIGHPKKSETAPQCIVFADSHAEARFHRPYVKV
ncbi:hypothetical protein ACSSS7_001037 [Eimeria intestinalis]